MSDQQDPRPCCASVWRGPAQFTGCEKAAAFVYGDLPYCTVHYPPHAAQREAAKQERVKAKVSAALSTPTASGDMVSVPRELIRSTLAHLEFIERNTGHDARDLRQRLSAANESVQAQPVAGDADAARYRYIVDNNIILSGGGWPIAPFGRKDCDRYIDARLAQAKGENNG